MPRRKVSILVPVYNDAKYLDACVRSLLAQDMTDFEALFLLNGCTDASGEILAAYDDARIKTYSVERNISAGPGLVLLLEKAGGEYIKPFSADDTLYPDGLSSLVDRLEADRALDLVFAHSTTMGESGKISRGNLIYSKGFASYNALLEHVFRHGNPFSYPTALVRAAALPDMIRDLRYQLVFDLLMWLSLILRGHGYAVLDKPVAFYRLRARQGNTVSYRDKRIISKHCFEYEMLLENLPGLVSPALYEKFTLFFRKLQDKGLPPPDTPAAFSACYADFLYNSRYKSNFAIDLKKKVALRMLFRLMADEACAAWMKRNLDLSLFDFRAMTPDYYLDVKISAWNKYLNKFREYVASYGMRAAFKRTFYFFVRR